VRDNFAELSNGNRAILSRIHLLASGLVREVTSVLAYAFLDLLVTQLWAMAGIVRMLSTCSSLTATARAPLSHF
jgi:hypothetical protein